MTTAHQVLDHARSELGTIEGRGNRTEYAREAGHANGQPWCATFVVAMFRRAGMRLPSESAYTPTMEAGFRKAGRWLSADKVPPPGAVVFYRWRVGRTVRTAHVGIVEVAYGVRHFVAIEGNTDRAGGRTGGRVMRQVRRSSIVGYGLPAYDDKRPPAGKPATPHQEDDVEFIGPGSNPNSVMVVKRALLAEAKANGQPAPDLDPANGTYGPKTVAAVAAYQRRRGVQTTRPGMAGGATLFFLAPYRA